MFMSKESNLEKLQRLLREMFQFDSAELDFGIYRIMNYKRDVIEKFISEDLAKAIANELSKGALAEASRAVTDMNKVKEKIIRDFGKDALNADGNLAKAFHSTPVGKKYIELRDKVSGYGGSQDRPYQGYTEIN
jgi:adenine-specific DNA-methyltransferase